MIEAINHHTQAINVLYNHYGDTPIIGIEIGTAEALLTKGLLYYLPNLTMIYAIDPYLYEPERGFEAAVNNQAWHDDRKQQAVVALEPYEGRYTHLCTYSDDAVSLTPTEVDFVWIDGDHRSEQITKDILNYYPKVKSGGIFGGHDWNHAIQHVKRELKETVMVGLDLTWWLVKK